MAVKYSFMFNLSRLTLINRLQYVVTFTGEGAGVSGPCPCPSITFERQYGLPEQYSSHEKGIVVPTPNQPYSSKFSQITGLVSYIIPM